MKPVLLREMHTIFSSWAEGDPQKVEKAKNRALSVAKMMNLEHVLNLDMGDHGRPPFYSTSIADPRPVNREMMKTQFLLGCVRYFRDHGSWPSEAGELIPKYFDDSFRDGPLGGWRCVKFPRSSGQPLEIEERPVFCHMEVARDVLIIDKELWAGGKSPTREQFTEYQKKLAAEKECHFKLQVSAEWPVKPVISKELMNLLKEKPATRAK